MRDKNNSKKSDIMEFRNILNKLAALFIPVCLCLSCSVNKDIEQDKNRLIGRWILVKASFSDDLLKDYKGKIPYIEFDNKEGISGCGSDSCSDIDFKISNKGNSKIKISVKYQTLQVDFDDESRYYADELIEQVEEHCKKVKHNEFTETLQVATSYKLKNDTILVLKNDEFKLEFQKDIKKN